MKMLDKKKLYYGYSKDFLQRSGSSSGGISGVIASYILNLNGIVFGASYSNDFKQVKIIPVYNVNDYYKFISKSKYAFSVLPKFRYVKQLLDENKLILFTGCPCQIKALKQFLKRDYDNLITLDLFCHGMSRPDILFNYITDIEKNAKSKVKTLNMRFIHKILFYIEFENETVNINHDIGNIFINKKNLLTQCLTCKMHWNNNFSDITVGDFWKYNNNIDKKFSPYNGTNLIKINTYKGLEIFNFVKERLEYKEYFK